MRKADQREGEGAVAACYSTWAGDYYDQYYGSAAPYPPVHADLFLELLISGGVTCLLDAGCGPASFLKHMGKTPVHWHGFDLTQDLLAWALDVAARMVRADATLWLGCVVVGRKIITL